MFPEMRQDLHVVQVAVDGLQVLQGTKNIQSLSTTPNKQATKEKK